MAENPYDFCDDCTAEQRVLGTATIISPMAQFVAGQRMVMRHNHTSQFQVIAKPEVPEISTGYEMLVSDYIVNPTKRKEDGQILEVALKYAPGQWANTVRQNPRTTVIYYGSDSRTVDYFHLDAYTKGTDGYGFKNILRNRGYLSQGNFLPKDVILQSSPTQLDSNKVGMGLNVMIAPVAHPDVAEDAFIISDTAANRMTPLSVRTMAIEIHPDQIPLDIHGDGTDYKFILDIGETVGPDGILMALRKSDSTSFATDTSTVALRTPQTFHDEIFHVPPGATIADLDIYVGTKQKLHPTIFSQLFKYRESLSSYYQTIVKAYHEAKLRGWRISERFNTLVTTAMMMLLSEGKLVQGVAKPPNIRLMRKKEPISHVLLIVTYTHPSHVSAGAKFTDDYGGKGVGTIRPEAEMPVDEYGFRADMVIDIDSCPNRMNPGWLYCTFITRMNWFMRQRIQAMLMGIDIRQPFSPIGSEGRTRDIPPVGAEVTATNAWDLLIEYLMDIYPKYADEVIAYGSTPERKMAGLKEVIDNGFELVSPAFNKFITDEWVIKMDRKWPAPKTPITYAIHKRDGTVKWVTTKKPVHLGSKYMYLLYKMPKCKASGAGYTSQHRTPIHPSPRARMLSPGAKTPLRLGEDEVRNLIMAVGPDVAARILALYANSDVGMNKLMDRLLRDPKPTNIDQVDISTKELIRTNNIINLTQHMLATTGVDITTRITPDDPRSSIQNIQLSKDIDLQAILNEIGVNTEDLDDLKEGLMADLMSALSDFEDGKKSKRSTPESLGALDDDGIDPDAELAEVDAAEAEELAAMEEEQELARLEAGEDEDDDDAVTLEVVEDDEEPIAGGDK